MPESAFSRAVSAAADTTVALGGDEGELLLNGCSLTSGEKAVLYCKAASGEQLALARLTSDRPHCSLLAKLSRPVTFSSTGGKILLNGVLKRPVGAVSSTKEQEPPSKKAKTEQGASSKAQPAEAKKAPAETTASKAATTPSGAASAPKPAAPKAAAAAPEKLTPAAASKRPSAPAPAAEAGGADFKASPRFAGARPGFVFKKGPQGVGYYKDKLPVIAAHLQSKQQAQGKGQGKGEEKAAATSTVTLKNGLAYEVLRAGGRGPAASPGKSVQVRYDGRLAKNGKRFDKGVIKFRLGAGEVIQGWDHGVNGMLKGEKRRLKIPSKMGYGQRGAPPDIPKNADLIFEVELLQC